MSKATDTRLAVLKVLGGQSADYYIFPNAAAFAAEGLDPADVALVLDELHEQGKVEREVLAVESDAETNGDAPEALGGGYRLRDNDA